MRRAWNSESSASGLKDHAGFWLRFVSNHVSCEFARKLTARDVTVAEWVVLREAYGQGDINPSRIADATGLTRGAISKIVERLVAKHLIVRRKRGHDRRYQSIAVTPSGNRLVPVLAAIADRNDEAFFAPLSKTERDALIATLKKLVEAHGFRKVPTE